MKSLNRFQANIGVDGVISMNRYDVTFLKSKVLRFDEDAYTFVMDFDLTESLKFRCESLNIPGVQIGTTDFKLHGGMPTLKIPNTRIYDEVQMTFLATKYMQDKYFFEEWIDEISDFRTNNVSYYKDCSADIIIHVYNEHQIIEDVSSALRFEGQEQAAPATSSQNQTVRLDLVPVYSIKLIAAIPTRIETFQVGWGEVDSLLKYTVNFSYEMIEFMKDSNITGKEFKHLDKKFQ
jgi:hypothetical protein